MTVSVFSLIKNEEQFIGYGALSLLPHVDEIVYFDGNSDDGTLPLLEHIQKNHDPGGKLRVFRNRDFRDFRSDYVRTFNDCMRECRGDYLFYCHPDMILADPGKLADRERWESKAFFVNMRSFAGEDMGLEITRGRTGRWKTIMKNAFGLEYWGAYGHPHEDMYFKAITGNQRVVHKDMGRYPFRVEDSGIRLWHFCECKPRDRREQKMETVLRTIEEGMNEETVKDIAGKHPRVTLEGGGTEFGGFRFEKRADPLPEVFDKYGGEIRHVLQKHGVRGP